MNGEGVHFPGYERKAYHVKGVGNLTDFGQSMDVCHDCDSKTV